MVQTVVNQIPLHLNSFAKGPGHTRLENSGCSYRSPLFLVYSRPIAYVGPTKSDAVYAKGIAIPKRFHLHISMQTTPSQKNANSCCRQEAYKNCLFGHIYSTLLQEKICSSTIACRTKYSISLCEPSAVSTSDLSFYIPPTTSFPPALPTKRVSEKLLP